jgi:hemoglobin
VAAPSFAGGALVNITEFIRPADELLVAYPGEIDGRPPRPLSFPGRGGLTMKGKTVKPNSLRVGPGVAVGITEPLIVGVVHEFYRRIRREPTLGPIFERVIGTDWDAHLVKMCDFWSSVLLMSGRFHGTPMMAHIRIEELGPQHFALWLRMFRETVTEVCQNEAAALFISKAEMIAQSLQMGIASSRGEVPSFLRPISASRQAPT